MCLLCAATWDDRNLARRSHVLRLLALVEHPDALPAATALRLAREILRLTQDADATTSPRPQPVSRPFRPGDRHDRQS